MVTSKDPLNPLFQKIEPIKFLEKLPELAKFEKAGLRRWLRQLPVGQKISLGYLLTVGIAASGAAIGVFTGHIYEQKALEHRQDVVAEMQLPSLIQTHLMHAQIHLYQLPLLAYQSEPWQKEYTHFKDDLTAAEIAWSQLKASYTSSTVPETHEEMAAFSQILETYDTLLPRYRHQADLLIQSMPQKGPIPPTDNANQLEFLQFYNSQRSQEVQAFLEELNDLMAVAATEAAEAETALNTAAQLRSWIILMSLALALALASSLSLLVGREITRPLEVSSQVARQVVEEANFDLQAPVTTTDEVGHLAQSLNHLIGWVKQLLAEQEAARVKLLQAEKMSSLGQLVAGIAHEINNPVNFIHGNLVYANQYTQELLHLLELYQQHYPKPPEEIQTTLEGMDLDFLAADLSKLLQSMQGGTQRIRDTVQSLRNFSRLDESNQKTVDIHEGIDSTLMILHNRFKARLGHEPVEVIKDYGTLPLVECYPGQLNQVMLNLLANALDAIEEHAEQQLQQNMTPSPGQIRIKTAIQNNHWVSIQIADNGAGMPDSVRSHLFDPFFTTKPVGKGVGMGLAVSYQIIVETHRGDIQCQSSPGRGTEFMVKIPLRVSR